MIKTRFLPILECLSIACLLVASGTSRAAVILDRIGDVSSSTRRFDEVVAPSQIFTDFPDFDCTVLEEFTVGQAELKITAVSALFRAQGGFIRFQDVQGYYLNFFSDVNLAAGSLHGDVASLTVIVGNGASVTQVIEPGGDSEYGLVRLDIDVPMPSAGKFWVGVSPISARTTTGQFFLQGSSPAVPELSTAKLANPGLGFGIGALSSLAGNYGYTVTAVPEPSAGTFAILAGSGLMWWRRRQKGTGNGIHRG